MRVCFYTLGCKVNQNETGALAQLFEQNGFTVVEEKDGADVYMLEYDKAQPEIGEGLLKSAYNYAANHGAYIGILSVKDEGKAHLLLNFEKNGDVLKNDIPSLLAGHCRCEDNI